jgi:hypothetical protein
MLPLAEQFRLTISVPAGNELHEPVTASEALLTLLATSATPMALLPAAPRCSSHVTVTEDVSAPTLLVVTKPVAIAINFEPALTGMLTLTTLCDVFESLASGL